MMILFHGGIPGLKVGDLLLPPSVTGVKAASDFGTNLVPAHRRRLDRVYFTTLPHLAAKHAVQYPAAPGDLYAVEPVGPVEDDDTYRRWCGCSPAARVAAVVMTSVSGCRDWDDERSFNYSLLCRCVACQYMWTDGGRETPEQAERARQEAIVYWAKVREKSNSQAV